MYLTCYAFNKKESGAIGKVPALEHKSKSEEIEEVEHLNRKI